MFLSSLLSAYAVEQFEPFAKWISVGVIALLLIVGAVIFFIKKPIFGKFVKYAFFGIRAGVLALIVKAWYAMFKKSNKHIASYIISVGAFVCAAVLDVNVLFVIIGCAIAGYAASALIAGREKI